MIRRSTPGWLCEQVVARFGEALDGRILAAWGLAGAGAVDEVAALLDRGTRLKVPARADDGPAAPWNRLVEAYPDAIIVSSADYQCLIGADALLVRGDRPLHRRPDFHRVMVLLRSPIIFDGAALYPPERMAELGFEYYSNGRPPVLPAALRGNGMGRLAGTKETREGPDATQDDPGAGGKPRTPPSGPGAAGAPVVVTRTGPRAAR